MAYVERWLLHDPGAVESVRLPLNPNKMDSPTRPRNMTWAFSSFGDQKIRGFDTPGPATDWNFSGVLLTEAHYTLLLDWTKRLVPLHITDHLGRTFEVVIKKYDPVERPTSRLRPWRCDYTITCLLLGEI